MTVLELELPGLLLVEPDVYRDRRGVFLETWNAGRYPDLPPFVQDNVSRSRRDVLRGLHYQHPNAQGKLVGVVMGEVWDVAVDIRQGSPTFGRWWGTTLSDREYRQLYIPPGFAHGFVARSDVAIVQYKCTALYSPSDDRSLRWDDPDLAIDWPVAGPVLSDKDRSARLLADLRPEELPRFEDGRDAPAPT